MNQLELCDTVHQNRMNIQITVQPLDHLGHHDRHFHSRRRSVDHFSGCRISHIILNPPIVSRIGLAPTISMKESRCDEGEPTAILLTIRYLYESNNEKFPKYIVVKYSHGITEKYPFTNIPSMIE